MPSSLSRPRQLGLLVALLALILGVAVLRSSRVEAGVSFNEGLESLNSSGTVPVGWWRAGYGTNSASWYLDGAPHGGRVSQGLRVSNWRSGDRKLLTSQTGAGLPVIAGRTYDLSAWYRTDGTAAFVVYRRTSTGSWTYWTSSRILPKSGTWVKAGFTTPVIPSGTTGLSFGVALASNGTLVTDDYTFAERGVTSTTTSTSSTSTSSTTSTTTSSTTTPAPSTSTTTSTTIAPAPSGGAVLVADAFDRPDGLVTNEYAFWNPSAPDRIADSVWSANSGSLFSVGSVGWSGVPDDREPNATSSNGTNSAIFRLISNRTGMSNVEVSFRLRNEGFSVTSSTPSVAWDGVHAFLRYASEESLYYASVNRRDGTTQIKKKVPGGPSNGGTYYILASGRFAFALNQWQDIRATIVDRPDGSVHIELWANGALVAAANDAGVGGPIVPSGRVGIRGDNTQFSFDSFVARSLS